MKIYHLRNASFIIETKNNFILIDPMLGDVGTIPPFSKKRFVAKRNPTVSLPENASNMLKKVTHCLITHSHTFGLKALQHTDHLDKDGEKFLKENIIPVVCRKKDKSFLLKNGLKVEQSLSVWKPEKFLDGEIMSVPATHGRGFVKNIMANGVGFFITLPDEPSIYISGDTVFTKDVKKIFTKFKPDISVMASGSAQLDFGKPILMTMDELLLFSKYAPGKVIANHLESLNHCPTSRKDIQEAIDNENLGHKVYIPFDGEVLKIS